MPQMRDVVAGFGAVHRRSSSTRAPHLPIERRFGARARTDTPAPTMRTLIAIALRRGMRRGGRVTAVDVGGIAARSGKFGEETMMRREMADRIGGTCVTKECKCLTPAAAEILEPPRAARARLLHPVRAPKGVKRRRVTPDIRDRMLTHRPEFEPGDTLGGVAGQHRAGRGHVERASAP